MAAPWVLTAAAGALALFFALRAFPPMVVVMPVTSTVVVDAAGASSPVGQVDADGPATALFGGHTTITVTGLRSVVVVAVADTVRAASCRITVDGVVKEEQSVPATGEGVGVALCVFSPAQHGR
jgi:hypothetical protein